MKCPLCWEPGGFHVWPCRSYSFIKVLHPELIGPGNSQAFMAWQQENRKRKK